MVLNLVWVFASAPWFLAAGGCVWAAAGAAQAWQRPALALVGASAGLALVGLSPPTSFVFCATAPWVRGRDGTLAEAWRCARSLAVRVQLLGLGVSALVAALVGNILFYQRWGGWIALGLSGLMLWLLVGLALGSQYLLPLLVARPQAPLRQVLRDAAYLVLGNLRLSVGLLLGATACAGLGVVSGAGLALGAVSAVALLLNLGLVRGLQRFGGTPVERDPRGWRDLLRPWT